MRYEQFAENASQKDPNKMLALVLWADSTVPIREIVKLGKLDFNNPEDTAKLAQVWYNRLQNALSNTSMINIARQPEYKSIARWMTQKYAQSEANFEDMTSQVADNMATWLRLKKQPNISQLMGGQYPTDVNYFTSTRQLQKFLNQESLRELIQKYKNVADLEKAKRGQKEITLIDNDRFFIAIPLNYASCYVFNNSIGRLANFCTGSSSGINWFNRYSSQGPMIDVLDKNNLEDFDGKWQLHAPTNQIKNGEQSYVHFIIDKKGTTQRLSSDQYFAYLFPGLLKQIAEQIVQRSDELQKYNPFKSSSDSVAAWDANTVVQQLSTAFPNSWNSIASSENSTSQ